MGLEDTLIDAALPIVMIGGIPGYFALQILLAKRYRGGWRIAALIPLVFTVPLLGYTAYAFAQESNLWPLMLLFYAPFAAIYLLILLGIHGIRDPQPV
jgi:hypothetical protein